MPERSPAFLSYAACDRLCEFLMHSMRKHWGGTDAVSDPPGTQLRGPPITTPVVSTCPGHVQAVFEPPEMVCFQAGAIAGPSIPSRPQMPQVEDKAYPQVWQIERMPFSRLTAAIAPTAPPHSPHAFASTSASAITRCLNRCCCLRSPLRS